MYIKTTDGSYPLSEQDVRNAHPNVSGPMPYQGYAWVFPVPQPSHNAVTQMVRETTPVLTSKGTWEQAWEVVKRYATQAEEDAAVAADRSAAISAKWQAIKAKRDSLRFDGGVLVQGHWFLTTAIAQNEYNSLFLLGVNLPASAVLRANWRTMSGATVDMTVGLVSEILSAGFAKIAAIDDAAQAHKAALEAAANPGAYDFSAGWPAVYQP